MCNKNSINNTGDNATINWFNTRYTQDLYKMFGREKLHFGTTIMTVQLARF